MPSQEHQASRLEYNIQSANSPENGDRVEFSPSRIIVSAEAIGRLNEAKSHKYITVLAEITRRQAENQITQDQADAFIARLKQLSKQELGYEISLLFSEKLTYEDLRQQYDEQEDILTRADVFNGWQGSEKGIRGIDNERYPFPSFETVVQYLTERSEILRPKIEQGFTRLLLVPFAKKIDELIGSYKNVIREHAESNRLFAAKLNLDDPNEALVPLDLDGSNPVYVWDEYNGADMGSEPKLIYLPHQFSEDHGGKTKRELIAASTETPCPGWAILLAEDLPNIPRVGKGKPVGSRAQIEAGASPAEYLTLLQEDPTYQHEAGMTPEDWLIYALNHLERTNQAVDYYQGNGSIAYLTGAYFSSAGYVPRAYFDRDARQAYLGGGVPGARGGRCGVRVAVRV